MSLPILIRYEYDMTFVVCKACWPKFILECLVNVIRRTDTNNGNKCLPSYIIKIVDNLEFWSRLYELQNLLLPLYSALNKLQKDVAREITH
ncbi:hypothetical protein RhiirA4_485867 [Rhizophagus irregularis]|uniref:Uncharacterized protein n=1 Tax=Rhizophagus irregularis TaxID=588596 RepID=A0A2I1HQP1_9GLOM|nr:hypothetical protein RhiirA4_485867 [Rhizophagus irregularis]